MYYSKYIIAAKYSHLPQNNERLLSFCEKRRHEWEEVSKKKKGETEMKKRDERRYSRKSVIFPLMPTVY